MSINSFPPKLKKYLLDLSALSVRQQRHITTPVVKWRGAVVELEKQLFGGRWGLKRRGGWLVVEGQQWR